jgi:hypothetical protein
MPTATRLLLLVVALLRRPHREVLFDPLQHWSPTMARLVG